MSSLIDIAREIPDGTGRMELRGPYRPYATLIGDTEVVVSQNKATMQGTDDLDIDVLIEEPTDSGFKSMRINIPSMRVESVRGMSAEDVSKYQLFVCRHCGDIADRIEEIWKCQQ